MSQRFTKLAALALLALTGTTVTTAAFASGDQTGMLEAFKRCDAKALKGKSGRISPSVVVKKVLITPVSGGGNAVTLQFTKGFENSMETIKAETGFDFSQTSYVGLKNGDVIFQREEGDGVDNYLRCEAVSNKKPG